MSYISSDRSKTGATRYAQYTSLEPETRNLGWKMMATVAFIFLAAGTALVMLLQSSGSFAAGVTPGESIMDYFVRIEGGRFVVGPECKPFYVSGWNQWETIEASSGALTLYGASLPSNMTGPQMVRSLLQKAQTHGFNAVRTWAHPVSLNYALMSGPGEYNEEMFRGLDYFLDEARKHDIRPILTFVDNWQPAGGIPQFNSWNNVTDHETFFYDDIIKQTYKDHVSNLLNRVNTVNGRVYKNDPTILSWELINEPRCSGCEDLLQSWVSEMAAFVKSIDQNHLLTIGEEGFYPLWMIPQAGSNPSGWESWAAHEGQNFLYDHSDPNIDYTAIHLWIQNWDDATAEFAQRWIQQHIDDAKSLNKPLLVSEFGAWGIGRYIKERDYWYDLVYGLLLRNIKEWGPVQGALFWQWFHQGQTAPEEEGRNPGGLFGVFENESTFDLIKTFTAEVNEINEYSFGGHCLSENISVGYPPADCSSTWIDGIQGTGFEGVDCDIDINECSRAVHNCHEHAGCINTHGGFKCMCHYGYSGTGKECKPNHSVLRQVEASYFTNGVGQLACVEGEDVAFPPGAPGWMYDTTKANTTGAGGSNGSQRTQIGSLTPVTPHDCMLACSATSECNSFSFNSDQQSCFLKKTTSTDSCPHPPSLCVATRGEPYPCGFWESYFDSSKFHMEVTSSSTSSDEQKPHMSRIVRTKVPSTVIKAYTAALQAREQ